MTAPQVIENAISVPGSCSLSALKALRLNRLARLLRLLQLLRLARLSRWNRLVSRAKDAFSINPGHIRMVQLVIFVFFMAHFLSCILYGIIDWEAGYATKWATGVTFVIPGSVSLLFSSPYSLAAISLHPSWECGWGGQVPGCNLAHDHHVLLQGVYVLHCPDVELFDGTDEITPNSPTQYIIEGNRTTMKRMCVQDGGDWVFEVRNVSLSRWGRKIAL